ncbi:serine hydrolase domain-containing protein [Flavobacterium mesophilum]|uniref:serine hydrolase domain-containing protein n=1 Tax=Flavobacterium mesophilum TaxID=3143495 RepID=UPI0031E09EAC
MKELVKFGKLLFQIILLFPFICFSQIKSDNQLKSKLDSLVDQNVQKYFKDPKAVALSIGIVLNGKNYFYNYGETEVENSTLPTKNTIYELGSITKTFTGIMLAQAVIDKKINLNDDIRKYLKGDYPNLEYNGKAITIQDLSNHTSRITRIFPNLWKRAEWDSLNPYKSYTKKLLFEGLHDFKMDTLPGVKYTYSNMGTGVLGIIIEDVYHDGYFNLASKYILKPLKMSNTTIDLSKVAKSNIAMPHNKKREIIPLWDNAEIYAIGALRSNAVDMVKYISANNAEKMPSIALSHKFTFKGTEGDMGLNWFMHTTSEGIKIYEHGGGTGGSRSSLDCFPDLDSGFIILTNSLANRNDLEKDLRTMIMDLNKNSNP